MRTDDSTQILPHEVVAEIVIEAVSGTVSRMVSDTTDSVLSLELDED
jgi:hypothetical protein